MHDLVGPQEQKISLLVPKQWFCVNSVYQLLYYRSISLGTATTISAVIIICSIGEPSLVLRLVSPWKSNDLQTPISIFFYRRLQAFICKEVEADLLFLDMPVAFPIGLLPATLPRMASTRSLKSWWSARRRAMECCFQRYGHLCGCHIIVINCKSYLPASERGWHLSPQLLTYSKIRGIPSTLNLEKKKKILFQ